LFCAIPGPASFSIPPEYILVLSDVSRSDIQGINLSTDLIIDLFKTVLIPSFLLPALNQSDQLVRRHLITKKNTNQMSNKTQRYETRGESSKRDRDAIQPGAKNNNNAYDPKKFKHDFSQMIFKMHSTYNEEEIIENSLKHWKKEGNIAANTLRGIINHFPPAPNANDVGPTEAEQSIYAKELEEWRRACNDHNAAILKINDTHMGMCDSTITKKLEVEYTVAVLEDRRRGHVLNPLTLLKSIVRIANGVTKEKKRELLLILEREIQKLKDAGQFSNESFDKLHERWKSLYSRLMQINSDYVYG